MTTKFAFNSNPKPLKSLKSVESVKSVKGSSWVQAAEVWSSVCSRIYAQVPVGILAELTAKKFQAALAFPIFSTFPLNDFNVKHMFCTNLAKSAKCAESAEVNPKDSLSVIDIELFLVESQERP